MRPSFRKDECQTPSPAGFSIFEVAMVLLVLATILAALTPGVIRIMAHTRVNRAANVVAAQFYVAQSLAGRQRRPVWLTVNRGAKTIAITDAVSATRLAIWYFGLDSEFKLPSLTAAPDSVRILPNGMANVSIVVDVGDASYKQRVRMTKAGQIRILR